MRRHGRRPTPGQVFSLAHGGVHREVSGGGASLKSSQGRSRHHTASGGNGVLRRVSPPMVGLRRREQCSLSPAEEASRRHRDVGRTPSWDHRAACRGTVVRRIVGPSCGASWDHLVAHRGTIVRRIVRPIVRLSVGIVVVQLDAGVAPRTINHKP